MSKFVDELACLDGVTSYQTMDLKDLKHAQSALGIFLSVVAIVSKQLFGSCAMCVFFSPPLTENAQSMNYIFDRADSLRSAIILKRYTFQITPELFQWRKSFFCADDNFVRRCVLDKKLTEYSEWKIFRRKKEAKFEIDFSWS